MADLMSQGLTKDDTDLQLRCFAGNDHHQSQDDEEEEDNVADGHQACTESGKYVQFIQLNNFVPNKGDI